MPVVIRFCQIGPLTNRNNLNLAVSLEPVKVVSGLNAVVLSVLGRLGFVVPDSNRDNNNSQAV